MSHRIIKCEDRHFDDLLDISRLTFHDAFSKHNKKEDFEAYMKKTFDPENFRKEFDNPHSEFYFLLNNDQLCGYIKLNEKSAQNEPLGDFFLEIERIYLKAEWQKKGLGALLINYAIDVARLKKKTKIWLGVWEENVGAIRFYQRIGFRQFGEHTFYMGTDPQLDLLLELTI
jgi:ribosomal protein S18 acetylase RimI-like enzyme